MNCALCKGKLKKRNSKSYCRFRGWHNYYKKNVPANTCKQCGEYYIDTEIAIKLENIVEELRKKIKQKFLSLIIMKW